MLRFASLAVALAALASSLAAQDVVRLGNQKFAHYGAVSYMKELAPKYNLKIEERFFAKGIDIIPAFVAGEVDISASAMDGSISGRAGGAPIYVVAGFSQGGSRIVARTDLPEIKTMKDFKGRKIAVARGGAQEIGLLAELDKVGLSWSDQSGKGDVQIVYMNYADIALGLTVKGADGACQSEPQSTQLISKGIAREILKPYDTPMGKMPRSFAMTEKLYKEKPDVALRVMKCFVEATRKFIDDTALAEKYVCEQVFKGQLTPQEFREAMSNAEYIYDLKLEEVQVMVDYMVKLGIGKLPSPAPKAADFVRLDLLAKAKAELGIQ
ncbi:MAG: ABC transporter substrate-binding protein [Verrucomicrobia bacterium]|nr:ABC transporter substrate-binding protein [Verrucomicrobiota bacterium]